MSSAEVLSALVEATAPAELPTLAAELARALGAVLARVGTVPVTTTRASTSESTPGTLLTVKEAAERLCVAQSWLYRHAKALPFTRKLGHRTLRFDARGLERWSNTRPAA